MAYNYKHLILLTAPLLCACSSIPENISDLPSQFTTLDDSIQVHYKSWGEGPQSMLFVHGFGCDMNAWEAQFDAFKTNDSLRLIFIDLPGYGQSSKPHTDYTMDLFSRSVLGVCDAVHADYSLLVGHSLGTPVCRWTLMHRPDRVAGLLDVDGVYCLYPKLSDEPTPEEQAKADSYEQQVQAFAGMFDGEACRANIEGFVQSLAGPNTPAEITDYAMRTMPETPEYVASSTMHNLIDPKWWPQFVIPFNTEVICTQNSGLEPDNREQMEALYSNMEYTELTTCGHFIQLEQPEVVNSRLEALRRHVVKANLETYDFAINELEQNYVGFEYKVTDANRAEYEQIKQEYRDSIAMGAMYGPVGASEICCYMQDFHLGCSFKMWSNRFPMKWANYGLKMTKYDPQPVAQKISDQTFLLRFPTCNGDDAYIQWVADAVEDYHRSGCEQLIVDVRGNGGGSDYQYSPILRLLYLQPGMTDGIMMRNSQANRDRTRELVQGNEFWTDLMDKAEAAKDSAYFELFESAIHEEECVDARRPKQTAIIIDHAVGSSGEQFLLDVRAVAPDIKFYGKENSLGCIDISNVRRVQLPNSPNSINIPTTISKRVTNGHELIDGIGIEPDVRIDLPLPDSLTDNVDPWVLWVSEEMEKAQ